MNFTKLAQKNVDHYNNHTAEHNAITVVYAVAAVVMYHKIMKRIAGVDKFTK